jgi:hypothetical protein
MIGYKIKGTAMMMEITKIAPRAIAAPFAVFAEWPVA